MFSPRKATLAVWTTHYRGIIIVPGATPSKLLPVVRQCDQYDPKTLKTTKLNLVRQMENLKIKFDSEYQTFFNQVGQITSEILYKSFGKNPNQRQKTRSNEYWVTLQQQLQEWLKGLDTQIKIMNDQCADIMVKVEYTHLHRLEQFRAHQCPGAFATNQTQGLFLTGRNTSLGLGVMI